VLSRSPRGRALDAARRLDRILDLDPSFLPALQALQRAVESGDDAEGEAVLDRLMLRHPRGQVLDLAQAFRRILDGRAAVAGLSLRLECRPATPPKPLAGAPP